MKPVAHAPKDVDEYVHFKNPKLMPIVRAVEQTVRETVSDAREGLNSWGVPTFSTEGGTFAWFMVNKGHVTFGFDRGTALQDPHGLLEGTGANMRHIKLRRIDDLERPGIQELIRQAARLAGKRI